MSAVPLTSFEACSRTHRVKSDPVLVPAHYTITFDLLIDAEKKLMKLLHVNLHLENIRFVFKYQQAEHFVRFWNCKCLSVTHLQICSGMVKNASGCFAVIMFPCDGILNEKCYYCLCPWEKSRTEKLSGLPAMHSYLCVTSMETWELKNLKCGHDEEEKEKEKGLTERRAKHVSCL